MIFWKDLFFSHISCHFYYWTSDNSKCKVCVCLWVCVANVLPIFIIFTIRQR